jgi:hypothetical protein
MGICRADEARDDTAWRIAPFRSRVTGGPDASARRGAGRRVPHQQRSVDQPPQPSGRPPVSSRDSSRKLPRYSHSTPHKPYNASDAGAL